MQRHLRRIDRTAKGQKIAMEDLCQLTPAYDLLNVAIVNPADREELALSLNGKKSNLKKEDFLIAGETMGIENSVVEHLIIKYLGGELHPAESHRAGARPRRRNPAGVWS